MDFTKGNNLQDCYCATVVLQERQNNLGDGEVCVLSGPKSHLQATITFSSYRVGAICRLLEFCQKKGILEKVVGLSTRNNKELAGEI